MPLVKIDILRGRHPVELRMLADTIHKTLVTYFAAPEKDRYQIITQHEANEMICLDTGLGFERSDKLVFIQIFQQGRSREQKLKFYHELQMALEKQCRIKGEDLIVTMTENGKEDWSFGTGRAQFIEGDL